MSKVSCWPTNLFVLVPVLFALAAGGCARKEDFQAERAALRQADIDFAKATAERGVDGWVSYFAEDGSMFPGNAPIVTGKDAIRAYMAPAFADPSFSLTWQPTRADVSRSGDLGYTVGSFERKSSDPQGNPAVRRGKYVTIWKKQADGNWKVVVDIGNLDQPPPARRGGRQ
jgi:uncharacterized protein (TIGR02246 family)